MSASAPWRAAAVLTLLAGGRAMTLAYVGRAGDAGPGDPPAEWLMPLLGDAAVGLTAVVVVLLMWRAPSPVTWAAGIAWSSIGAFDALAAFLVNRSTPWPEFFMLRAFGSSMFFLAAAMQVAIVLLLTRPGARQRFGVAGGAGRGPTARPAVTR